MDKGELYDSFETMEAQANEMAATLSLMRNQMTQIIEKNNQLEVENTHLRERLATGEAAADVAHALGLAALPSASVRARDADLAASIVDAARKLALPSA